MNPISEKLASLSEKISAAGVKLEHLEKDLEEIGQPAAYELKRRFDALKIEEKALRRNFEESIARGEPDSVRLEKVETLLRHIENEETSVQNEADFLHQAAPSSVTIAAAALTRLIELYREAMQRILGDHHPLGRSVFVNHTHENLTSEYGLEENGDSGKV